MRFDTLKETVDSLFTARQSVKGAIKTSHIVIIIFMLIPLLVSMGTALYNSLSYDRLITNVNRTNSLNRIVKIEIANELWDIVAGNVSFADGRQYAIIEHINSEIERIRRAAGVENRRLLDVAHRAMNTLVSYVDLLGNRMRVNAPVVENERTLDEIRGVAVLVSDTLQDFTMLEIESAAGANEIIKKRTRVLWTLEIVMFILVVGFSNMALSSVAYGVQRSIGALVAFSGRISSGDLEARAALPKVEEFDPLTENLNIMAVRIKGLIEANIEEQRNLQKSEMKALQAQISPHFLYNTLDTIVWLAEGKQWEQVISVTRALSAFFRLSLNQGSEWVTVDNEFKHIESYMVIQKIRYRDILDYSIAYDKTLGNTIILKLLLQPLVENALYHGIKNRRGRGMISIKGWSCHDDATETHEEDALYLSVSDNGAGISEGRLNEIRRYMEAPDKSPPQQANGQGGYGLYNVSRRLELYYNMKGLLHITSSLHEGTTVTVKIPGVRFYA
ncbi:MAG: sensor histidine kinase [Treponema sp.]|jgi:two-component system sensor histidine kinase YesM|nr:sensor histidine kinase [Treponema sp.]